MSNDSAWSWVKKHGGQFLHVNNGTAGIIGVKLRGMTFLTQYDSALTPEVAFVQSVCSAQLWWANSQRVG
jgi:hypothetical protein